MDMIIVTGMSGAGKSKSLKILEDLGYLCMDNIMPQLIENIVDACERNRESMAVDKLAISVDVRGGVFFNGIFDAMKRLRAAGRVFRVVFLDASDEVLVNRYKESRRDHPLSVGKRVVNGIREERELLSKVRECADVYIDTSHFNLSELKQKLYDMLPERGGQSPAVILMSFGLKRGIPMDCDMIYDVRFLPNPFYNEELRKYDGSNPAVVDYVFADPNATKFVESVADQIELILPSYLSEVKSVLVVGIGCTGGKHRSVAVTERLAAVLKRRGAEISVEHRDLFKE